MEILRSWENSTFSKGFVNRLGRCGTFDHNGCVNTACWSEDGNFCATGSDDRHISVWDMREELNSPPLLLTLPTGHQHNIFCVDFVPASGNRQIVSCSADGTLRFHDFNRCFRSQPDNSITELMLSESSNIIHKFAFWPGDFGGNTIFTAEEAGYVRRIDIREPRSRINRAVPGMRDLRIPPETLEHFQNIVYRNFSSIFAASRYWTPAISNGSSVDIIPFKAVKCVEFPSSSSPLSCYTMAIGGAGTSVSISDIRMMGDVYRNADEEEEGRSITHVCQCSLVPRGLFYNQIKNLEHSMVGLETIKKLSIDEDLEPEDKIDRNQVSVSGIAFSKSSYDLIVSYQGDAIYRFNLNPCHSDPIMTRCLYAAIKVEPADQHCLHSELACYTGHLNHDTFLKSVHFFGPNDEFIVTGSDQGFMFVYDTKTEEIVGLFKADNRICNGVLPHPTLPMLLTYGIDSDAKLWKINCCEYDESAEMKMDDNDRGEIAMNEFNISRAIKSTESAAYSRLVCLSSRDYSTSNSPNIDFGMFYEFEVPPVSSISCAVIELIDQAARWNRLLTDGLVEPDSDMEDFTGEEEFDSIVSSARTRRKIMFPSCSHMTNTKAILCRLNHRVNPNYLTWDAIPDSLSLFASEMTRRKDYANKLLAQYNDDDDCATLLKAIDEYTDILDILRRSHAHVVNLSADDNDLNDLLPPSSDTTKRPFLINGGPLFIYILLLRARRILSNSINLSDEWDLKHFYDMTQELNEADTEKYKKVNDYCLHDLCQLMISGDVLSGFRKKEPMKMSEKYQNIRNRLFVWVLLNSLAIRTPDLDIDLCPISYSNIKDCKLMLEQETVKDGLELSWLLSQLHDNGCDGVIVDANAVHVVNDISSLTSVQESVMPTAFHRSMSADKSRFDGTRRLPRAANNFDDDDDDGISGYEQLNPLPAIIRRLSIVLNLDSVTKNHCLRLPDREAVEPKFMLNVVYDDDDDVSTYSSKIFKLHGIVSSNLSLALLKMGERGGSHASQVNYKAKDHAIEALKFIPGDVKALFRLGCAQLELNDAHGAVNSLSKAARLKPGDAVIEKKLVQARKEEQQEACDKDQLFKGLFKSKV